MARGRNRKSTKMNPCDMFDTPWMNKTLESPQPDTQQKREVSVISSPRNVEDLRVKIEMKKTAVTDSSNTPTRKSPSSDMFDQPQPKDKMVESEPEKQPKNDLSDKVDELTENMEDMKITKSKAVSIPEDIENIKHPLGSAWTLWYYKNDRSQSWEQNQRQVLTVDYAEDFLGLYRHTELASRLADGSDYSLFKKGINPDWEDRRNAQGGRWIITLDRRQRADCLDGHWFEILLLLIGADMPDKEVGMVNGAAVNIRKKGDKLAVWVSDCGDMKMVLDIGKRIKERLGMSAENTIQFNVHSEEKARVNQPKLLL